MYSRAIDPSTVDTIVYDWGYMKWLVTPDITPGTGITFGEVILLPMQGHGRHNHPGEEEILYVLSGSGEMVVDDGVPFRVVPGDTVHIPVGVYHSSQNTGWEPWRLLAIYNPGGPEKVREPDWQVLPPGVMPRFRPVEEAAA